MYVMSYWYTDTVICFVFHLGGGGGGGYIKLTYIGGGGGYILNLHIFTAIIIIINILKIWSHREHFQNLIKISETMAHSTYNI